MKTKLLTLVTLAFLGLNITNAQVGIGTDDPDPSAILEVDVSSLTEKKGFLPPRMDTAQRDEIISPATGLTIYNTDTNCVQFYTGATWYNTCNINLVTPSVYNPSTGQIWMDRNIGANQVAQSFNDPAAYGDLYQWGRAADGHQKIERVTGDDPTSGTYTAVETGSDGVANFNSPGGAWDGEFITRDSGVNNWVDPSVSGVDDLWQGVNGTNNPCPAGYRVPTEAELNAERLSWSSNGRFGAFASPLKWPVAGFRDSSTGGLKRVGLDGNYLSSTVSGADAKGLFIGGSISAIGAGSRASAGSVRCLKD